MAHIFQIMGLLFILTGVPLLRAYAVFLRFKDELVAYLGLMLIIFYVVFISIISTLFNVVFPKFSEYIFIEFILIFQFVVYLIANKVTQPITNIIEALNDYIPGKAALNIPIIRKDEIGLLTEKLNAASRLSFEKISQISKMVEREQSIIRIFETMRRISNQNVIKDTIINEIKNTFNPDRCFIALYNSTNDSFYFDNYIDNLPSKTLFNFEEENEEGLILKQFNDLFKNNLEVCFESVEDYISKNVLQGTPKEKLLKKYNIKASCNIPIYYAGELLGYLILQYTNDYRQLSKDDLLYLKQMATQIGITINQTNS